MTLDKRQKLIFMLNTFFIPINTSSDVLQGNKLISRFRKIQQHGDSCFCKQEQSVPN